jgi:hypothetical protein
MRVLIIGRIGPKTTEIASGLRVAVTTLIVNPGTSRQHTYVAALPHVKVARDVAWTDAFNGWCDEFDKDHGQVGAL